MRFISLSLLAALLLLSSFSSALAASLEVGEPAPEFLFEGTDGAFHRLSEHRGRRGVVVAWFPKAFTPG